jgi:hypothetical protein
MSKSDSCSDSHIDRRAMLGFTAAAVTSAIAASKLSGSTEGCACKTSLAITRLTYGSSWPIEWCRSNQLPRKSAV